MTKAPLVRRTMPRWSAASRLSHLQDSPMWSPKLSGSGVGHKHGCWLDGVIMQRALGTGDTTHPTSWHMRRGGRSCPAS